MEKARLDNQRATLERKKTLTASEERRLATIDGELGEDVAFIDEQEAVKNAQLVWIKEASEEISGAVEGSVLPAPLNLIRPRRNAVDTGVNDRC